MKKALPVGAEDEFEHAAIAEGTAEEKIVRNSLQLFCLCIYKITGKKTVILIDEYDVPLENAYFHGFYDKMISFIRSLFEAALKTNYYLQFAVITGCLRICMAAAIICGASFILQGI